jgi:sorting nexin-29
MISSNYRPITLLNVAYKIFTTLINNRLSGIVESKLEDCQMGFRLNRSTINNIFIVRKINEKYHEFNIELHNVSIDYTQAFDSVYRDKIIKCSSNFEIPSKLIKLIAETLQDTKLEKVNQNYKEKFEILTGVKQGDPLSATLFSIVTDDILKQLELRDNVSTRLKQCSAYANYIVITARTKQTMIDTFEKLKNISLQFGLIVNENKNKYMKCTRKENQLERLTVGNIQIDQVRSFSYLGTIVHGNNTLEEEIIERIVKGNKAFYANRTLF